ncbi:MAG: carboxypeptidase M32 [Alphaproteobacteria bacterium]|nr:carboxypeptidase M32 [Alphaproteobacteria bacterium]
MSPAYPELEVRFRRIGALAAAGAMLDWDAATMMPAGAAEARIEQLAHLALTRQEYLTRPEIGDLLDRAEAERAGLDAWQAANLREMRREWRQATALPPDLVEALTRAANRCELRWRKARPDNDFEGLLPLLEEVLRLTAEKAKALAAATGRAPYDALLDLYEPGARSAAIDLLFDDLAAFLPGFLARAVERQARQPQARPPAGPFPIERQKALGESLMRELGFEFERGRLDVSAHPFTGGVPDDVRLTTRYDEADFTKALMGVLHETGHGLYELGLPKAWRLQPVGSAPGMALHESQSLLIEMQLCRSRAFLEFAAPAMRAAFEGIGAEWEPANLARLYQRVAPGLIRVDADEVTYPCHVILRYRLEKALLAGDLKLADLPGAWRAGMRDLLGIEPPDDRDGCLQDIHWPSGAFGYFPTYTMGAIAAAQLFAAAKRQDAAIEPGIARGEFKPLLAWLRREVHGRGHLHHTDDLLRLTTGAPLSVEPFKAHLAARYLA